MATSKAQRQATAERRARCVAMRREGHEWHDIAATLGYAGAAAACKDYRRAMDATRAELDEQTQLMRTEATVRWQAMAREAWKVLRARHVTVSHGRVIERQVGWETDADGVEIRNSDNERIPVMEDLLDDAPVLQALDRLAKIEVELAKLWGYAAPVKVEQTGHVAYSIEGVDLEALR